MQIANGIEMLEISATVMGRQDVVHPTLIWDSKNVFLVDTGYPGQKPIIHEAMELAGVALDRLSQVIITHQDLDHIGSCDLLSRRSLPRKR